MYIHVHNDTIHNIQINKIIGENEKCVFYFTEKTKQTFWPTHYVLIHRLLTVYRMKSLPWQGSQGPLQFGPKLRVQLYDPQSVPWPHLTPVC